jgi:hypothetical protein
MILGDWTSRAIYVAAKLRVADRLADGRFRLNPPAEPLREGGPDSLWALAVLGGEEQYRCWVRTSRSTRPLRGMPTGRTARQTPQVMMPHFMGLTVSREGGKIAYVPNIEEHAT